MRTRCLFLARTVAVTVVVFLAISASPAQPPERPAVDEQAEAKAIEARDKRRVPRRYLPFQGQWHVVSLEDAKGKTSDCPEILVTVRGMKFELSGSGVRKDLSTPFEFRVPATKKENPYRALQEAGVKNLGDIVDIENQIQVFWFVGIYQLSGDELHLALKYCGQGVEGANARNFRPPSSFQKKPMDGEIRITLKRQLSLDDLPDLEAATYRAGPYIRAAAMLQDMGKDKATAKLSKLASSRKHDNQAIVLCRMLFTRKPKGEFRRPALGAALFLGGTDYTAWPLEPIELVDGVPFLITRGYDVGGEAEPAEAYLKYCLRNCDWNSTRFKPKDDQEKRKALQKLLASPKWKARLNDAEKGFLASQILPGGIDEVGTASGRTDEAINITDALSVRFFPMKVGYKWVYAFKDKEVNFEVLRKEKSRGTTVFVIRRTFEKRRVEYKLAVEESGVYIHQEGKKVFSPPLRQFAFLPRSGDLWKW